VKQFSVVLALAVVAGCQAVASGALAGRALDEALQPNCSRTTCVVQHNPGGDIELFKRAARELVTEGKRLVIDGVCASACVILADIARRNTCVTPSAKMQVHQAMVVRFTGQTVGSGGNAVAELVRREDPPHSPDIDRWVRGHGGYPADGVMQIPVSQARKFWASC
jgi:hypothetical protein